MSFVFVAVFAEDMAAFLAAANCASFDIGLGASIVIADGPGGGVLVDLDGLSKSFWAWAALRDAASFCRAVIGGAESDDVGGDGVSTDLGLGALFPDGQVGTKIPTRGYTNELKCQRL